MENKPNYLPSRDPSRPDRSRSPHREVHPWEEGGQPKSVLYPADIQFHRQSSSKANNNRSPIKPSNSPSKHRPANKYTRTSPLKEHSQIPHARALPIPHDPDRSVRKLAERLQKWNEMHSSPKFMAGLMPKHDEHEPSKPHQTTPKSRKHESWTIEYFTREPFALKVVGNDQNKEPAERSHPSKENIRVIEKPRRRANSSPTCEDWEPVQHDPLDGHSVPTPSAPSTNFNKPVKIDADGYAIPSTRSDAITPPNNDGAQNATTPGNLVSPDDVFYTPMTHIRPSQREQNSNPPHSVIASQFSPPAKQPQFSLISGKGSLSAVHSPFERNISLKERTEAQLAAFDKVSNKIDIAIKQARDVLSKPIRLGLPPLDTSAFPSFSENRQTMDPSQLESLKRMRRNSEMSLPRRSLPVGFDSSLYRDLSNSEQDPALDHTAHEESEDVSTAALDHGEPLFPEKNQTKSADISLPMALGASMAAELAYAERVEKVQSHLVATREIARKVEGKMGIAEQNENADIDAILDSIVLQDKSLVTFECENASANMQPSYRTAADAAITKPAPSQFQSNPTDGKKLVLSEQEEEERMAHIDSYIRMRKHLHSLQLVVLRLKKRSQISSKQSERVDQLIDAVNKEHEKDIEDAELLLTQRLTPREFLLLIKHRQQKVYVATEKCGDTIKQLLNLDSTEEPRKGNAVPLHKKSTMRPEREAVRSNTGELNDSVGGGGVDDLSARTMRRNLEARREQAEMLNRSFEERSRDIEQKTKKSIAVQIHEYDRVIAERTNLINHLEKISTEERYEVPLPPPRTPTPRRDGIAPLDLSQLSQEDSANEVVAFDQNVVIHSTADNEQSFPAEDQADVGIARTRSQSTVYEDSLSHFSDEEERPTSVSSEATLYQSDLEGERHEVPDAAETDDHRLHSRRTLDTAETLAMLSRSVVAVATTSEHDGTDQKIQGIINEAVRESAMPQVEADVDVRLEKVEISEGIVSALRLPKGSNFTIEASVNIESAREFVVSKRDEHELVEESPPGKARAFASGDFEAGSPSHAHPDAEVDGVECSQVNEEDIVSQPLKPEKVSVVVRPPKDFSRLRLFFGSPDEPTEDSVDCQPTDDDDMPNDQFVSKAEPTSDMMAEDTDDSDRALETSSVNDDEDVPVITLRRFVYKEPVIGEKYQEDTELEKTQWEVTPPGSPVKKAEEVSSAHESTLNNAFILDLSATQKSEGTVNDLDEVEEKNEWSTDDEQPPMIADVAEKYSSVEDDECYGGEKEDITPTRSPASSLSVAKEEKAESNENNRSDGLVSGECKDDKEKERVTAIEKLDLSIVGNDDVDNEEVESRKSTEGLVLPTVEKDSPVNLEMDRVEIFESVHVTDEKRVPPESFSMVEQESPIGDAGIQSTPTPQVIKHFEDISEIWPESLKSGSEKEGYGKDVNEVSSLERTNDGRPSMGLNRSELCDSLSTSIIQLMTDSASPRRRSLSQIARRYELSESLLEDSISSSSKSPRAPKERFTTKMPASISPRAKALLEEGLDYSLAETIVKSEAAKAITDEKIREIDEMMASLHLKPLPVETNDSTPLARLNTSLDETYEDLLSIEKPSSVFDKIPSTSSPPVDLPLKHLADTPRKIPPPAQSPPSPEAIKRQHFVELKEKLDSPEWMDATCDQFSKDVWSVVVTKGFVRPLYDDFVPAPTCSDNVLVETEDERKLLENKKTLIWAAVIELAAMLWPEHPDSSVRVSSKWLPIPTNESQFSEMAIRYMREQDSELPPSHRYKRQSRPPAPPYADPAIDEAVARYFYSRGSNNFARRVDAEYRKMCGELIDLVGDRFVSSETQRMYHSLSAGGDDVNESLLRPSSSSFGQLSGDFGRPSLARLSIGSGSSIGRRSSTTAVIVQPLTVVHEE